MFESYTAESIKTTLLEGVSAQGWSVEAGTLAYQLVAPIATQMAEMYANLDDLLSKIFVDETAGVWIDVAANTLGLYRLAGDYATCTIALFGTAGTQIPSGTLFCTDDGLQFELEAAVTLDSDGVGAGTLTACAMGEDSNIAAAELTRLYVSIQGLSTFQNSAATGGVDIETDGDLYARLVAHRQTPATSGNVSDYAQWATAVAGVGYVRVTPLISGNGTVGVTITTSENTTASDELVEEVAAYIEENRPVGAAVTVVSADGVNIDIVTEVVLTSTANLTAVEADYVSNLDTYLASLMSSWADSTDGVSVIYNRVLYCLLDVDGVVDVGTLTINGESASAVLDWDEIPILGEVSLSAAD